MSITLASLRKVRADQPPRLLIYGPEKMGKTTLASQFPAPVFIQTEHGESAGLELDSFGHLTALQEVLDALAVLATEEHPYSTVVIDSISALEKLIWKQVCENSNTRSIELAAGGYGKGYVEALTIWNEDILAALNYLRTERGMTVILIGHSIVTKFDDPETQSYSVYEVDLFNGAKAGSLPLIKREVDAILLIKKDVTIKTEGPAKSPGRARADGGDTRWIYTQGRPAFTAGNRYSMPDRLMFPDPEKNPGAGYAALAPFLPAQPQPANATATKKAA